MPLPTRTWNASYEALPAGSETLGLADDRKREMKLDTRQRVDAEHHFQTLSTEDFSGEHRMGSARICRGTAAQRASMQIDARTTDILPGVAGHGGGVDNSAKINNPNGLVFYEEDTGLTYYHNGTVWAFLLDFDFLATLATTFRTRGVMAFRVKSPTTATTLRVNVNGGLYVDTNGTVREYAGDADFLLAAADATNPRIDLLYLAGTTLTKLEGTPAGVPVAPAIPSTAFPLAYLFVRATSTAFEEADGGGTKSYLYKDLRGIVTKPPRHNAPTRIDGGAADVAITVEVVRVTTSITPAAGNVGVWFECAATYNAASGGTPTDGEMRLYIGGVLKTRAYLRSGSPASGTIDEASTISFTWFEPTMASSPTTIEVKDIRITAGGAFTYKGTIEPLRLFITEIA